MHVPSSGNHGPPVTPGDTCKQRWLHVLHFERKAELQVLVSVSLTVSVEGGVAGGAGSTLEPTFVGVRGRSGQGVGAVYRAAGHRARIGLGRGLRLARCIWAGAGGWQLAAGGWGFACLRQLPPVPLAVLGLDFVSTELGGLDGRC